MHNKIEGLRPHVTGIPPLAICYNETRTGGVVWYSKD